ncbi:MAG: IclR family transcriptional regulator [Bacillota bacterium]
MKPKSALSKVVRSGKDDFEKTTQTVDRAIRILEALAKGAHKKEFGVTEIADSLGLSKATVYRLLCALSEHQFVDKNPETQKYRLGWGIFEIGNKVPRANELQEVSRAEMVALCNVVHETINLAVRDGSDAIIIDKVDPDQLLRLGLEVGRREPLHATALGKVLLSECDEAALEAIYPQGDLPPLTKNTLSTVRGLKQELATVRANGYATDNEEFCPNVCCVAAPIRNYTGKIIAAMSVSGPAHRLTPYGMQEILPTLLATTQRISRVLGHRS